MTDQEIQHTSKLLMNLFLDGITPEEAFSLVGSNLIITHNDYQLICHHAMELMKTYINRTKGV